MDKSNTYSYNSLPKLKPNSIYSLADLHLSFNNVPQSAPPISNNSNNKNDSVGHERDQFFFGRDFSSAFQTSIPLDSAGTGSSALIGSSSKRANSSDSINELNNQQYNTFLGNLYSPTFNVPLSAPPMNNGSSNGSGAMTSAFQHGTRSARAWHKARQPEYFSLKVFLGGIPANLTTNILQLNFAKFGKNQIDWPKKSPIQDRPPNGYAFAVFDNEQSILQMLRFCHQSNNRVFFPVYTLNGLMHPVEVKIWEMKNTVYATIIDWRKFRRFSVFVGGIPRTCTAAMLTCAIEEVIGPVAYCTIELDPHHFYPKGAACVVFTEKESYIKAIAAHEVMLSFGTFERKVEFKAFLASNMPCEKCGMTNGTRYCQEMICLAYYCMNCWKLIHNARPSMSGHTPSKRHVKNANGK